MIKILLTIPRKDNAIEEIRKFLAEHPADIYVFPEGFLSSDNLEKALEIIKSHESFVVTGLKDNRAGIVREAALVIDKGEIIGDYTKCILTKSEREKGKEAGKSVYCIDTRYGKIGLPICYEIHFPEVTRVMALDEPVLLINLIGTGMYHELQYEQWTSLAKARAIENEVFVIGCSHYSGEIPLAFAFSPQGRPLIERKNQYGCASLEIDLDESKKKKIQYFKDRTPACFSRLCE